MGFTIHKYTGTLLLSSAKINTLIGDNPVFRMNSHSPSSEGSCSCFCRKRQVTRFIHIKTYIQQQQRISNYTMNGSTTTTTNKVIKVRLELHAQNLKNVAGFGQGTSDPFAIVTLISNQPNVKPTILGKTEVYVAYLPSIFFAWIGLLYLIVFINIFAELKIH